MTHIGPFQPLPFRDSVNTALRENAVPFSSQLGEARYFRKQMILLWFYLLFVSLDFQSSSPHVNLPHF